MRVRIWRFAGLVRPGASRGGLPRADPAPGHLEQRAAEVRVGDTPLAARRPHDRIGYGQAESGAAALLGRPVEAVEQPVPELWRHAGTAVFDGQAYPAAPCRHADRDSATVPGVAARVVD